MKRTVTLLLVLLSFTAISQPVLTALYNPNFGDIYVYKIVDDTSTVNPGQAGAGVTWNLTSMHGDLTTRQYDWKQTAQTSDATIFGNSSNLAAEIIQNGFASRFEYYNVGAAYTGDFKKVGSRVGQALTNYGGGFLQVDYPFSFNQSCTDSMVGTNGVANIEGTCTTTYDGYGLLQLEPQSGGNFANVARIKVEENYILDFGVIETHHMVTYYWFDNTTTNLRKQPIAIIMLHDWIDTFGDPHTEKYGLMRQILFQNEVPQFSLTSSNVAVSPNPFRQSVTFSLPPVNADVTIQISDITGRLVKTIQIAKSAVATEHAVNLGELRSGVYIARIISGKSTILKRIVRE